MLDLNVFNRLVNRNNADLGKGVPRPHVFHEAWELLFFFAPSVAESHAPSLSLNQDQSDACARDCMTAYEDDRVRAVCPKAGCMSNKNQRFSLPPRQMKHRKNKTGTMVNVQPSPYGRRNTRFAFMPVMGQDFRAERGMLYAVSGWLLPHPAGFDVRERAPNAEVNAVHCCFPGNPQPSAP